MGGSLGACWLPGCYDAQQIRLLLQVPLAAELFGPSTAVDKTRGIEVNFSLPAKYNQTGFLKHLKK